MNWKDRYTYNFPTAIRFGWGVIDELAAHLKEAKVTVPLLVTDPFLEKLPFFTSIVQELKSKGLEVNVFSGIDKNPIKSNVKKGVATFLAGNHDCVIGLGGGASVDVARAIVLWSHHQEHDLFDFDDASGGDRHVIGKIPHFIAVPTTSGTGSEVGRSTVISDDETHKKVILFSPRILAAQVFADPALSMDLPSHITAATGLDALTHNIEAYLSKGFSPICDGIALEGIRLILESIETATLKPDQESRSKMMIASLMGATAFQKGLGVVHSTAHPLSTLFDMHHGLANAVMLSHGMNFNQDICQDKFKMLEGIAQTDSLIEFLQELNTKLGLPISLKGLIEVDSGKLDKLVSLAMDDVCHLCNPKPVTLDNFREIYTNALA
jgi:alcohol dehydrogenase class IV